MTNSNDNVQFWNYVLHIAETVKAADKKNVRKILLDQLTTLNEAFSGCDPVENYEAYVVLKLSAAISDVIESEQVD